MARLLRHTLYVPSTEARVLTPPGSRNSNTHLKKQTADPVALPLPQTLYVPTTKAHVFYPSWYHDQTGLVSLGVHIF